MIINWQGEYTNQNAGGLSTFGFIFAGVSSFVLITADNPVSVIRAALGARRVSAAEGETTIKASEGARVIYHG